MLRVGVSLRGRFPRVAVPAAALSGGEECCDESGQTSGQLVPGSSQPGGVWAEEAARGSPAQPAGAGSERQRPGGDTRGQFSARG